MEHAGRSWHFSVNSSRKDIKWAKHTVLRLIPNRLSWSFSYGHIILTFPEVQAVNGYIRSTKNSNERYVPEWGAETGQLWPAMTASLDIGVWLPGKWIRNLRCPKTYLPSQGTPQKGSQPGNLHLQLNNKTGQAFFSRGQNKFWNVQAVALGWLILCGILWAQRYMSEQEEQLKCIGLDGGRSAGCCLGAHSHVQPCQWTEEEHSSSLHEQGPSLPFHKLQHLQRTSILSVTLLSPNLKTQFHFLYQF